MHIAISAYFWGQSTTGSGQYLHHLVKTFRQSYPLLKLTLIGDQTAYLFHGKQQEVEIAANSDLSEYLR